MRPDALWVAVKLTYREFSIRPWEARDRAAAAEVIRTVLAEYGLPWQPESADRDVIAVKTHYQQTGGEFWVVEGGDRASPDRIIGTGAYYPIARGDRAVEIRKMYLLPEARQRGLGRFLLQELERAAIAKGYTDIWIETATVLAEAVKLYERNGYAPATGVETPRCDRVYVKRIGVPSSPSGEQTADTQLYATRGEQSEANRDDHEPVS